MVSSDLEQAERWVNDSQAGASLGIRLSTSELFPPGIARWVFGRITGRALFP